MTLFEAAEALLASAATTVTDPPARQYVSDGAIARDCEQLVVQATRTYVGTPSALATGPTQGLATRTAVLRVELARCSPVTGDTEAVPSADRIHASAQTVHSDHDDLIAAARAFKEDSGCEEVVIGDALPFGPEGGIAGWGLEVRAQLG